MAWMERHSLSKTSRLSPVFLRYIQAMLGHVRLDTTQIYTHVSIRMLKQVHTATHPAARLDSENDQNRKLENNSAQPVDTEVLQDLGKTQSGEPD